METHPIKFLLLNKNELAYEVLIRGGEPASTVLELRRQINKLCALFPTEDVQESGIDAEVDLEGVSTSVKELVIRGRSLQDKYETNLFDRTKALANHIYHRLNRMDKSTIEDKYSKLLKEFNGVLELLSKCAPVSLLTPSNPPTTQLLLGSGSASVPVPNASGCEQRNHISDLQKLKFNGRTCVHVFIQKVSEFCTSRNISHTKLLTYATEIFTDQALHWYRSVRDEVHCWEDLTRRLIADFSQFDYDYRLLAEIRNRTQGESENIIIYLAIMSELFSRLSKAITESEKLEIILHNIRPCYANTLVSYGSDVDTIDTLRFLCRNYEKIQALSAQFREPPRVTTETLAPDLAFSKPQDTSNYKHYRQNYNFNKNPMTSYQSYGKYNYNKPTNQQTSGQSNSAGAKVASISLNPIYEENNKRYCPRCRNSSHNLRQCNRERFLVCFKCGRKDVKYPDCTTCNPKEKSNPKN